MNIIFENEGEIDRRSFSSFGVNAKTSDSAIGYFGTGLKYAIAVLLREGCSIKIFSGVEEYTFYSNEDSFRDKKFNIVYYKDRVGKETELGYTTELGKGWEMWCAYRELYCNCMDEHGETYEDVLEPVACEGKTFIVVSGQKILSEHAKRDEFILGSDPIANLGDLLIHSGVTRHSFYKGVRVQEWNNPCLFTYNMIGSTRLTEDRTLADVWTFKANVAKAILVHLKDVAIMDRILLATNSTFERDIDFHGWSVRPSDLFLERVRCLSEINLTQVNPSAQRVWRDIESANFKFKLKVLSKMQSASIDKAVKFCERLGYSIHEYPIVVAESLGEGTLALAADETVYLTDRLVQMGTRKIASALIEEFLHLKYGYDDCSRELQTYLFDRIVGMGEESQGEPL